MRTHGEGAEVDGLVQPVEARVVIASVETYLKYAEAIGLTASAAAPA
ncbi:MAG: hypothetical protein HYU42_16775 [Candidatus Rokubacteria bacterium]|nr:hypothetical protein [Candidatus Rokubacteria bacterium]